MTAELAAAAPGPLWEPREGKALVIRTTTAEGKAYRGFQWPTTGPVEAPDWRPTYECGRGLHGLLWGAGDGGLLDWSEDALWYAVEVDTADVVDLDGKVKFPRGVVVHCGTRLDVVTLVSRHAPAGTSVVGGTATAGDGGTATAGDGGTATAGDEGLIVITWWDASIERYRKAIGEVGVDGIDPCVAYRVVGGKLTKVAEEVGP